jgi:UDP-N-acetylmuramoylalanine--D-glutamate ligase
MSRVVHTFLVGEAANDFAEWLKGKTPTTITGTIDKAVQAAAAMAEADGKGGVVLLSPACASFDQFPNFEVRGRFFVAAVEALPEVAA